MITLHRIGQSGGALLVNPHLILTVEETPDTVITMATGAHIVVAESAEEVVEAARAWRASVLSASRNLAPVR
ncbi:MAG TPA: flagellar FlbD family protein [Solirubrobacteraceae bacterium]|jgi:flagellar protein FlbD|nr:flagellar FlbD family protein [Solirubrobacteraceae bacterium]